MEYIAHKTERSIQTVKEHSENVAKLSSELSIIPFKELVYNIGLLHDIGKYQKSFQRRIEGANIKIPHAVCGALEAKKIFGNDVISVIMQYCIAGHHSGLQDFGAIADTKEQTTLCGNMSRETEDFSIYKKELFTIELSKEKILQCLADRYTTQRELYENMDFVVRYCFSCLTDADSLDTEEYCTGEKRIRKTSNFKQTLMKIDGIFNQFNAVTDLQKSRSIIQEQVYDKVDSKNRIFLMNMPTGSGKTLCSLKFALKRALNTKKKRIIYVIPYNSIIDQTAEIFETTFGELNILRHQSSFSYEEEDDEEYKKWALKTIENWDSDFIITTAVQFFESIYGNKRGKLRKLHNMADSIIIFDEAHLMPIKYLEPCMKSIVNITKFLNSDTLLLTATMPNFSKLLKERFEVSVPITDLIEDKSLFENFKKCEYSYKNFSDIEGLVLDNDAFTKLIIVNSKRLAKNVYHKCSGEVYHLSTYMTGKDRIETINNIKQRIKLLENDINQGIHISEDRMVTVVSTSLIEAGVDLDFRTVYRELSGLDSILQSGGRCNREGKHQDGQVVVFDLNENTKAPSAEQSLSRSLFREFSNIDDLRCIEQYYDKLFEYRGDEISESSIYEEGKKPYDLKFKSYAESFKFIDDRLISIVIPTDDYCKNIMKKAEVIGGVNARKIQKYVVSVALWEFEDLHKQGVIADFDTGVFFLTNLDYYDKKTGINFTGKDYYIERGDDANGIWI